MRCDTFALRTIHPSIRSRRCGKYLADECSRREQVLRPISRLGGITYGRTIEGFELLRPDFQKDLGGPEGYEKLEGERRGKDNSHADGKI